MTDKKRSIEFNPKISTDGTYRKIYGWTIICMVQDDMKILENILRTNTILRNHISSLPSKSYHVTIFGIFINQSPLEIERVPEMHNQLYRLAFLCQQKGWEKITLKIDKLVYSKTSLVIQFLDTEEMVNLKQSCLNLCGVNEWISGKYHMTLGYLYNNPTVEQDKKIRREIKIFNELLKEQTITILAPKVCQFSDMTDFAPWRP